LPQLGQGPLLKNLETLESTRNEKVGIVLFYSFPIFGKETFLKSTIANSPMAATNIAGALNSGTPCCVTAVTSPKMVTPNRQLLPHVENEKSAVVCPPTQ